MTYKLNPELRLIKSPVVLMTEGREWEYPDGESLTSLEFDKYYLIDSITAKGNVVVVSLRENDDVNVINWTTEEAISFV